MKAFGRSLLAAGLAFWVWRSLEFIPYCFQDPRYVIALEWGFWQNAEWVHPLFVPLLEVYRFALGLFGFSGRMFVPVELLNLAVGGLTLAGLYLAAERKGAEPISAAAAVLLLGFSYGFWSGTLRADPYALAAAFSGLGLWLLMDPAWTEGRWKPLRAGLAAGVAIGFHTAAIALIPAAVAAGWRGQDKRKAVSGFAWFLAGACAVVLAGYMVFVVYRGITLDYFARVGPFQMLENVQQVPDSSIYTSRDPGKQVRDLLENLDHSGAVPMTCLAIAGLFLGLLSLGSASRAAGSGRVVGLGLANAVFYTLFFLINNTKNGFVYAGFLSLPFLLAGLSGPCAWAGRLLLAPAVLASAWVFAQRGLPIGPDADHISVEARFLQEALRPGDAVILPGCSQWPMFYDRRLNFLSMGGSSEAQACIAPVASPETLAPRVEAMLRSGHRVLFLSGGRLSGEEEGTRLASHIFWVGDPSPAQRNAVISGIKARLEGTFTLEPGPRSPQSWEYSLVRLKKGRHAKGWAPKSLAKVERPELAALLASAPPGAGLFTERKIEYLLGWLDESPDDVFLKFELLTLAVERGKELVRKAVTDRKSALAMLAALSEAAPADVELKVESARLLSELGRGAEARAMLAKALELRPESVETLNRMKEVSRGLHQPQSALAAMDVLAGKGASGAGLLIERAEVLLELGRKPEALKALAEAGRASPGVAELTRMEFLYRKVREPAKALAALDALAVLRPKEAGVQASRAEVLMHLGKRAEALESLVRAAGLKPGEPDLRRIAFLFRTLGEPVRALAALDALAKNRPKDGGLQVERGQALLEAGRKSEALSAFDLSRTMSLSPDELRRAARGYQVLDRCDLALKVWDGLVKAPTLAAKDLSDKAVCAYRQGDWKAAEADLLRAIDLAPTKLEAYASLGAVYAGRGLYDQALSIYDRGLAVKPGEADRGLTAQLAEGRLVVLAKLKEKGAKP
ncbi:MAG: tetratricopeptide repeat protein [Elusimicrobia bacterium]|nr:tetratricopeptide repeat protein [Elusimicrobiota bacterium]